MLVVSADAELGATTLTSAPPANIDKQPASDMATPARRSFWRIEALIAIRGMFTKMTSHRDRPD